MNFTRQQKVYGAVLILLAVAILYFGVLNKNFSASGIATFTSGFSTLSLTQGTNYVSSDPFFNSPTYTLAIVADGSAGSLKGTFTPDQVRDFTGKQAPTNSFDVTVDLANQSCTYTLQTTDSIPVYSYSWSGRTIGTGDGFGGTRTLSSGCATSYRCPNDGCATGYVCAGISKTKIGEVYRIDTVTHYDSIIKVGLTTTNTTYGLTLTPIQKTGEVSGVMRTSIIGSLMGDQSCPVPSADSVIYRPVNTNTLQIKSSAYISSLTSYAAADPTATEGIAGRTQTINAFLASSGFTSKYCEPWSPDGITTLLKCVPASPVALPLLKMYVKADTLGINIPSGTPDITTVKTSLLEAATTANVDITLKNIGTETDSFDVTIAGKRQLNLQPKRVTLAGGETQVVSVLIQGAGIIGNYTARAVSVNNPAKFDSYQFRLLIEPFCDKPVEAGKIKVSTEFGCYYLCENQYQSDIREKTCQKFGTFESQGPYVTHEVHTTFNDTTTNTIEYPNEYHCTGIKSYTTLNNYMDGVLTGKINAFLPENITNAYFIPSPICNYVGEYGYTYQNGVVSQVVEKEYEYSSVMQAGVIVGTSNTITIPTISVGGSPTPVATQVTVPVDYSAPNVVGPKPTETSSDNVWIYVVGAIIIGAMGSYIIFGRKKKLF